ncbi:hypothetical protein G7Z17_g11555 [Cylindrodendrum hubeiense]|uniref:F-box domain-containing protein n=1 Tax=Cylindrodendrum hubeiense TaxID=595255 RepID=A0A9P5LB69_9HYPO|nr:hypothetical protein G7Z17_g11555 [Cylindrodendrum hubeiense]
MELDELPEEVLSHILGALSQIENAEEPYSYNPKELGGIFNARLVCRRWNGLATKHAFRTIHLIPTEHGLEAWVGLLSSTQIRSAARRLVVYSSPLAVREKGTDDWHGWEDGKCPAFTDAISQIGDLALIDEICLRFSSICQGIEAGLNWWDNDCEHMLDRKSTLKAVFEAIKDRASRPDTSKIHSVTIRHLQNAPLPDFTSSELFKSIAKDIDQLHLQVAEEYNEDGPDGDIYCIELVKFEPYMHNHWLSPLADHLTSLSLYFGECWGTMPGTFDGRGLFFPQLKTLSLGSYAISHHDHLDWVLAQSSLKTLRLDRCFILSYISTEADKVEEWNLQTHDWERLPVGAFGFELAEDAVYRFMGTWESMFDKIRTGLPNLIDFQFQIHHWGTVGFDNPNPLATELSNGRYIAFDIGLCPSRWIEPSEYTGELDFGDGVLSSDTSETNGGESMNRGKITEEGDRRAFEELLKAVSQRRR